MEAMLDEVGEREGVFFIHIRDKNELYASYMPFIKGGGLFFATDKFYKLGSEIFLLVKLLNDPEKYPVAGEVVWITPKCAQGGRTTGIGVRFTGEEAADLLKKMEGYLAGALQSERHTDTL